LPVEGVVAAWEINPDILTYEHPWIDAYDLSKHVTERQWFVNQTLQSDTNAHLYYFVSTEEDSVEVMLVLNGSTCPDTLRRTLPFSHTTLWVPNVFTPDAGDNNRFVVTLHEGIAEELVIYNRQGLLVARMEGPTLEWDGTRDGSPCPQGAYVWVLRHHSIDRPEYHKTITGTVTLIR
jgi:gliding motility-associated-like protein